MLCVNVPSVADWSPPLSNWHQSITVHVRSITMQKSELLPVTTAGLSSYDIAMFSQSAPSAIGALPGKSSAAILVVQLSINTSDGGGIRLTGVMSAKVIRCMH